MKQNPTPATAPTQIAPLPKGTPVTVFLQEGAAIPLSALPKSAEEVEGLRERREMLRDQLERATNRRDNMVQQLTTIESSEARVGVQQRLNLLDERILQIERDQAMTERLLSSASPDVLAQTQEQPNLNNYVDEDEAAFAAFSTFGAGILLTLIIGRIRRRIRKRRAGPERPMVAVGEDPRIERLTQAVDAIAEEVERIGEGQRFVTQLLSERREPAVLRNAP